MPKPTQRDVHVNAPLTNISIAYLQNADSFVASKVFPTVPVSKQSDRYYVYDRGDFNRDEAQLRADCTESAGGGYKIDNTPTYFCDVYAFHKDIGDQTRANADSMLALDREASEYNTHKMLIRKEVDFQAKYMTPGVWTEDLTGIAGAPTLPSFQQWDQPTSDPIRDVRAAMTRQQQRTGFRPNTMVLSRDVFDILIDHPDIVDRVKYGTQDREGSISLVDTRELMALWKIGRVFIMDAIVNQGAEGVAFESNNDHQFIASKTALLCYSAARPGLMTPSAGYDFRWTGLLGSSAGLGTATSKMRVPLKKCDRVEIEMAFDLKQVAPDMGTLFSAAIA